MPYFMKAMRRSRFILLCVQVMCVVTLIVFASIAIALGNPKALQIIGVLACFSIALAANVLAAVAESGPRPSRWNN